METNHAQIQSAWLNMDPKITIELSREKYEQCSRPLLVDDYRVLYYTQFIEGYSNPIEESLLTDQYNGMIEGF